MENRKRNVQIIVRVTEEERALIEKKMKQIPTINLSAYSRKMLIDGYIIVLDLQEVKAHTAQLQKIGVNVNQIARRINETRKWVLICCACSLLKTKERTGKEWNGNEKSKMGISW